MFVINDVVSSLSSPNDIPTCLIKHLPLHRKHSLLDAFYLSRGCKVLNRSSYLAPTCHGLTYLLTYKSCWEPKVPLSECIQLDTPLGPKIMISFLFRCLPDRASLTVRSVSWQTLPSIHVYLWEYIHLYLCTISTVLANNDVNEFIQPKWKHESASWVFV